MNNKLLMALAFTVLIVNPASAGKLIDPFEHISLLDSSRVHDLDEVVVVSQSKEVYRMRLQSLSSSVFTNKEIQSLNLRDLRELSAYVPSFVMPNYGSRITSSIYVRGIGSRVNSPAVGIYVDGMPLMSKSAFNFHTYQLDRVDVLRGPQGTLYGQNTEGGMVRMYSRNPMNYQGTDVNLGWGSHWYRNAEISHYCKLSDRLAFSFAGFYNGQNGFFRNQTTGGRADQYNEAGGKLRIIYQPTNRLVFDYLADYQYVRQNGFPYGLLNNETGVTAEPSTNYQGNYRRNIFNTALNMKFRANMFDFNSTTSYQYLKDYMLMDQDYLPLDYMHLEQRQFQNAITQEFSFKSNTKSFWHWTTGVFFSYQWLKTNAPVYFGDALTSPIGNAIQASMYNAIVNTIAAKMVANGMPQVAAIATAKATVEAAGGVSMNVSMEAPGLFHTPQFNLGIYHESNIDITDKLTATLGLRFDYNHVKIHYQTSAAMNMTANVMGKQASYVLSSILDGLEHSNYNQLLPKFGLNLKIDDNESNLYATVSKGYRAGGFNIQMFSDILQTELNANNSKAMRGSYDVVHTEADYECVKKTIAYKPETSWNYEVGTHLNLFDNMIHLDLSAFYMQVRNQQLSVMASQYGFGRMMVNAGKSISCGIEVALRGSAFSDHLSWAASYGYTRAVFKNYMDSLNVNGVKTVVDYKDKTVPFVPVQTFAANADYRFDFNSFALHSLTIGANVTGLGKIYWDEANEYSENLYAILGIHADADFGRVVLSLWGRNLTGTKYNTFAVMSSATGTTHTFAQQGNPLQFGVDIRLHF